MYGSASYTILVLAGPSLSRIIIAIVVELFNNAMWIIGASIWNYLDLIHLILIVRDVKRILKILRGYRPEFIFFHLFRRSAVSFPILVVT